MKPRCALCDRPMLNPAVLIGTLPVGPKCAKRAGLLELARKRIGRLSLPSVQYRRNEPQENLELFEEEGACPECYQNSFQAKMVGQEF